MLLYFLSVLLPGHCNVPQVYPKNKKLGLWVKQQRKSRNELPEGHRNKLDSIGFIWDAQEYKWNEEFRRLQSYHSMHGNCKSPELKSWLSRQVRAQFEGRLSKERITKLETLDVTWMKKARGYKDGSSNDKWIVQYNRLLRFREEYGHVDVPQLHDDKTLGCWVNNQRNAKRRGNLPNERTKMLEDIGFNWNVLDQKRRQTWKTMYEKLKEFQLNHGHVQCFDNKQLEEWICKQRVLNAKGQLKEEQKVLLDCLDFEWEEKYECGKEGTWKAATSSSMQKPNIKISAEAAVDYGFAPLKYDQLGHHNTSYTPDKNMESLGVGQPKPQPAPKDASMDLTEQLKNMIVSGQGVTLESFELLVQKAKKQQADGGKRRFDDVLPGEYYVGPPIKKRCVGV